LVDGVRAQRPFLWPVVGVVAVDRAQIQAVLDVLRRVLVLNVAQAQVVPPLL